MRFLIHITKGYRFGLFLISLVDTIEVGLSLLFVWYSKMAVDIAVGAKAGSLGYCTSVIVLVMLVQIFLRVVAARMRNFMEVKLANRLRYDVFEHLVYSRWEELSAVHSGDMLTRMVSDTGDVVRLLTAALPVFFSASLQLCGALVLLFLLDPLLAIILGAGIPFVAFFGKIYYRRMRKYTHQVKESESDINALVEENLQNHIVVRSFERQQFSLDMLESLQDTLRNKVYKRTNVSVFAHAMMNTAFGGGYLTAFLWGVYGLAHKTISFGTLTAYLQLVARIQRPVFDLMRLLPAIVSAKTAIERLERLTDFELEDKREKVFLEGPLTLKLDNVGFAYGGAKDWVFRNLSAEFLPGTMTAVMGETGVGKTTLFRLLLGLMKPSEGCMTIGNSDFETGVSELTRSNFIYVPQGNSLFSGSIRENLSLGNPEASVEDMENALRIASASFVFELPQGLDTQLGERGCGLSEGQAQRIAIARSLLRPGKILLLDEATSALDAETERRFLYALKENLGDRVLLFITHHAEVAAECGSILEI